MPDFKSKQCCNHRLSKALAVHGGCYLKQSLIVLLVGVVVSFSVQAGNSCYQAVSASGTLTTAQRSINVARSKTGQKPSSTYATSHETNAKFWKDVGLTTALLPDYVNNAFCYQGAAQYFSCMAAINSLLGHNDGRLQLIPGAAFLEGKFNVKIIRDMGSARLATFKPTAGEPVAYLKDLHDFEEACRKGWLKVANSGNGIDVEKLLASVVKPISGDAEESLIVADAINAFIHVTDAHGRIMPEEMLKKENDSDVVDDLVGVGVHITERDGVIRIGGIIEGGPAEAVGLLEGDLIVGVDGAAITGDLSKGVKKLQGPVDTRVSLTIKRGGETKEIVVIRKRIEIKNVTSKIVQNGKTKLGMIHLSSFMVLNAPEQIAAAVKTLESQGATSLVLDLRGNPGGSLDVAVKIASLFIGGDKLVVVSKSLYPQSLPDKYYRTNAADNAITTLPLVVLVDSGSASASELLSNALQDHKRAWVVGERSFGKGTVQAGLHPMGVHKALGEMPVVLFVTIARFMSPKGRTNQLVGVQPDFIAEHRPGEMSKSPREADIYPNALSSVGEAAHSSRDAQVVEQLKECLMANGAAKTNLASSTTALPHDYPVLVVFDLMACFDQLKVQPLKIALR